ncbi:hypothetical protein OEZ85_009097 [Tetradesmus obliquus]|uniref:TLC domain-containing protein n=1 Tax=Tetradesmus obliquus TaxID=3088 RepID=A0ABY8TMV6_TETOB|nr:hypothetical protein OEZ85_009097 [Tetradesmus obliquus]
MDPMRFILPVEDAEYQQALSVRSQMLQVSSAGAGAALGLPAFSRLDGLYGSLGLMVAFLMLRFLFNSSIAALTRRHQQSKERQQLIDKIEEEIWVTLGGITLLVAGWQCLFSVREYCGLHNTAGCLRNWPLIPVEANVHKYYNIELGWYLQLMLKHVMGLGLQDNGTMGAHHLATVALVVLSYMLNVHLVGLVVFGTLNLSSPLLHMSKLASCLELKTAKTLLFGLFAAVFFVTRVLLFPYFILKCCMYDALTSIRGIMQYFFPYWLAFNVLLVVLCAMQGVWFAAVLRVLKIVVKGSSKELQREVATADPAGMGAKLAAQ